MIAYGLTKMVDPHPTQQLVIAADTGKGELQINWQLRHLG